MSINLSEQALSVSQLLTKIKGLVEIEIGSIWVRGEISGLKTAPSGHIYFSLKDENALIQCVYFKNLSLRNQFKDFKLKDGVEVAVFGKVSIYSQRSSVQLVVEQIEPFGVGLLQKQFEALKEKLKQEGLFDISRKKPIPKMPQKVVLITSPTGAALQDMLSVLNRRQASLPIIIVPTQVQGEEAKAQIISAIDIANQYKLGDVIILARGGGSIEDLWCFNDENVVRAVANSTIPIISAIGHEVDFTLTDFAADLRAPTPSAAAELVSQHTEELVQLLKNLEQRMLSSVLNRITVFKNKILSLEKRLVSPADRLIQLRIKIDELIFSMQSLIQKKMEYYKIKLQSLSSSLDALSPLKVLGRGYTLVRDVDKNLNLIKSKSQVVKGKKVEILFHDGGAYAIIDS
jgi:exodeoxyribonuclease VII large subunit